MAAIDRALPLAERLASADRSKDRWLEMLAQAHNNRSVCLESLDHKPEADRELVVSLNLFETIARRSPANHRARFGAGRMRLNAGMALRDEGKVAEAVVEFGKAEEWLLPLRDEFRGVNDYLGMLGALYLNWARALVLAEDWPAATAMGNRALEIANELGDKEAVGARTVLAYCRANAGQFRDAERDFTAAIRSISDGVAKVGHSWWTREGLMEAYSGRARLFDRMKRFNEAIADWNQVIEFSKEPQRPAYRVARAISRLRAGQVTEAVADVEELLKSPHWNAEQWYEFARFYAVASGELAGKKRENADRAVELLQRAVKAGYQRAARIAKDPDLDALRGREEFQKLVAELKGKGK